ncbi:MAG TPA: 6-phosphogluconolactonase [Candidatus Polarisedimenticolia bacterium]|nr:6-phosphogluconolactonase [Candidatus Polarisedimenticolia bacterium]
MPRETELQVFPDLDALSHAAAGEFARLAGRASETGTTFTVALSGGSTPRRTYELLGTEYRDRVPWDSVQFFFSDERHVPPDHKDSNYGMAYRALLSRIPAPPWNAHRLATELEDPAQVAEYGDYILRQFFRVADGEVPRFDLIFLGLGADGHTASLFPGSPALKETSRFVTSAWVESVRAHRITLTLPVINRAAEVLFLVSGGEKAAILREVLEGDAPADRFPARAARPVDGRRLFYVDRAAAAQLRSEGSRS